MALSTKRLSGTGSPLAAVTARFPARADGLDQLHAAFERFFVASDGAGAAVLPADRVAMLTAAAEIAANIVGYACRQVPNAEVMVALSRRRDSIEARFEDPGAECVESEPDRIDPEPHLGIGLTVARACVDALE